MGVTFVVEPFLHSVRHVEGKPFPLRPGFHHFAVDVALGWRRQVFGFEDLEQGRAKGNELIGTQTSRANPRPGTEFQVII